LHVKKSIEEMGESESDDIKIEEMEKLKGDTFPQIAKK
jgi:hypothetical protein